MVFCEKNDILLRERREIGASLSFTRKTSNFAEIRQIGIQRCGEKRV
jgi:hypothetical protein